MPKASHKTPRAVVIQGDIAVVTLTSGYTSIIDAEDAARVGLYNWAVTVQPNGARATRKFGQKMTQLHRFVMNAPDGSEVDHINGNSLDNRKSNLRICSHMENMRNRKPKLGRELPNGIHLTKNGTYLAKIAVGGRRIYLGCHKSLMDAVYARRAAEREHYGEFAPEWPTEAKRG